MKTLKEYVDVQQFTGLSDMDIIIAYFVDNDMEESAADVAHALAKAKVEKMKLESIDSVWAYCFPSEYLYKTYSLDVASMLHRIEVEYVIHHEVTGHRLQWANEHIPMLEEPDVYYVPCIEWLRKQGISFRQRTSTDHQTKRNAVK